MTETTTTRPYLLRAIVDWTMDNALTPHILVNTTVAGVKIPPGFAQDGKITLNIHPQAVQNLELGNEWIMFSARFNGRSMEVQIPVGAVTAVFARENGQGFFFPEETVAAKTDDGDTPPPDTPPAAPPPGRKGPGLKIVK
jgi:stringent starvation protein B